jgi:hypothetical protein
LPEDDTTSGRRRPRWVVYLLILGLYLTLRGYHSLDGDQAYRLPLLLHRQDPRLFAGDPFVQAFDSFNPHRGALWALDLVTRPLGLSAGLFVVFVLTFAATCAGVDRLARAIWPSLGPSVGFVCAALVLAAKAGNVGTNHLFEAMVLDRLVAFALGWLALAEVVARPARGRLRAAAAVAMATLIHPSVGLQIAALLAASWIVWWLRGRSMEVSAGTALSGLLLLAAAVVPGLAVNLGRGPSLVGDMPRNLFWLLSVELQSPQHMLPHLWRMPQWLSWCCYLLLAALALLEQRSSRVDSIVREPGATMTSAWPPARRRLTASLVIILAGLGAAWYAIEVEHDVRVTIFQPFRMATIARGIALAMLAGRLVILWSRGGWLGRTRAILLAVALAGDWLLIVVTLAELACSAAEAIRTRFAPSASGPLVDATVLFGMLAFGFNFLAHHDTEYGHIPLLAAIGAGSVSGLRLPRRASGGAVAPSRITWTGPRRPAALALVWSVPLASLLAAAVPDDWAAARHPLVRGLLGRCRFAAVPADDIERLAVWCRDHTRASARFIGPPGPKTFRLWSLRSLAFNRAGSPYHAAALADWFERFQDHVGFHGSPEQFVSAYQADRHGFEARYQELGDLARAALARREGATHVIAAAPAPESHGRSADASAQAGPLELLHVEGRYAVYRVKSAQLVQRQR